MHDVAELFTNKAGYMKTVQPCSQGREGNLRNEIGEP